MIARRDRRRGGGSTELATKIDGVLLSYSMPIGLRARDRASARQGHSEWRERRRRAKMDRGRTESRWAQVPEFAHSWERPTRGAGRTVSTLAQLDAGLAHYDRAAVHHRRSRWRPSNSGVTGSARSRRKFDWPAREW